MARYTKTSVTTGDTVKSDINVQLGLIESAINDTLSRVGDLPNSMSADLDMNSNQILNLPDAVTSQEPMTLAQGLSQVTWTSAITDAKYYDTEAVAAADTALSVGDVVILKDRANGIFDVVTVGTTANVDLPNTYNIIVRTADATECLVLRLDGRVSVNQFGATGDGSTDDTLAIEKAALVMTGKTIYFEDGTYDLGSDRIDIDNPITMVMSNGVTIQQQNTNVAVLQIDDTTDVIIHGNNCKFLHSRSVAGSNSLYIRGSERVKVYNVRFENSPKDQVYISNSIVTLANTSKDVTIKDCIFDGARRQGISVIVGERLNFEGNVFHDVSGESPQAGIDLETGGNENDEGLFVSEVSITGNKFYDITAQSGLYIGTASNVTVQGNVFRNCLVGINVTGVLVNTTEKTISAVANATNQFTVTGHNMKVGDLLFITTTGGGTVPTGATAGSTYRVDTVVDADTLTFSTYYQAVSLSVSDDGTLPLQVRAYRDDRLNNITIKGNAFKDMVNQSIVADQANSLIVQGNVVDGGGAGTASMLISWCDDGIIDSNIITNLTDGEGIFCSGIRTAVTNNTIIGSPDQGIRFYGGEASRVDGNTLIDCGNDTNQVVDLRYFNNGSFSGNRIWDESVLNPTTAVDFNSADCLYNTVDLNNLKGSCASNGGSISLLDRSNNIGNNNALNDGAVYSAHLRSNTSNLTDIGHAVNTYNKYEGKIIFDSTANIPMFAQGSTAGDTWNSAAGGSTITPA